MQHFQAATAYGSGSLGGKGSGLVCLNEWGLPQAATLPCHILTTDFFDRYIERRGSLGDEDETVAASVLEQLGDVPISVRSSATNESGVQGRDGWAVHAGENISFMLPNNHPDFGVRVAQLTSAVRHIYDHFIANHPGDCREKMAIVVNPIPGLLDDTLAGPFFYPFVSGVANSFFPYALKVQDPSEGYARVAFGHGYATVLDDFPVVPVATIRHPLPLALLRTGRGQQFFYALDMTRNSDLCGEELETMKKLHVRLAGFDRVKLLGVERQTVTFEELVQKDRFGFRSGLESIMEAIRARAGPHFQIEFVFNLNSRERPSGEGIFHVVQLTVLPQIGFDAIAMPDCARHTYLAIANLQGHGIRRGVKHAVVLSPFLYEKQQHEQVRARLAAINVEMRRRHEAYLVIVPGRLGSRNPDWGLFVEYKDVDRAAAIFEYGVDIAGRVEPLPEEDGTTGGIYGSHFLYMVAGGFAEDQRRMQARMYGTQGTHFFTNIMSNNVVYGYVAPGRDDIDPWFFTPSSTNDPLYVLEFPAPVAIYADSVNQRCVVVAEN